MASYACNLSCQGCTNYSDLNLRGNVPWDTCKTWLEQWLERIDIQDFGIIGGEPLANPKISQWITGVRELMPKAQIRFTTNGLLLDKKFEIVEQLHSIGNSVFKISIHQNSKKIENIVEKIFQTYNFELVEEFGIQRYKTSNNFRFQINRPTTFIKSFKNDYQNMLPHSNNPADAFDICVQKTCPLLYKGKIYKCSTSGMLNDILVKFKRDNLSEWKYYKKYKGISVTDDIEVIDTFIKNFGKPEGVCSMCPSSHDHESVLDHMLTVRNKNEKYN
jgi:MoaA/NifB/PqqE/SkfB family radical SAM enzyme